MQKLKYNIKDLFRLRRRLRACTWINAKKKLLGGMSLNGQTIPVGGITPASMPKLSQENFGMAYESGSIKVPQACPWSCFSFLLPLIISTSLLLFGGCQAKKVEAKKSEDIIPVKVVKIALQEIIRTIDYIGNIKAQDEAIIYPKVSGKIIEKVREDGSVVNKGDVIAYIDRDEVGLQFEKAPVESPLSGIIGRIYINIGSNVSSQTPIALVVNMDKVKVDLDVPEIYLPKIFIDQEATLSVDSYPQKKFMGKVTKISPVVNLENRAAPIEITIENSEHLLKSGMFARVSLVIEKHPKAPVILKEAIIGKEPDTYVYLVEDNKAKMRKISLGARSGPLYEVTEGLKEGEVVVIMGQQRLYDNAKVNAEISNGNGQGDNQ
jgi:multidrug efflux pump subunit AcrA (membrane-fusion protein)